MVQAKGKERAGITAQTTVGELAVNTGGHSESTCCVDSCHTSAVNFVTHFKKTKILWKHSPIQNLFIKPFFLQFTISLFDYSTTPRLSNQ